MELRIILAVLILGTLVNVLAESTSCPPESIKVSQTVDDINYLINEITFNDRSNSWFGGFKIFGTSSTNPIQTQWQKLTDEMSGLDLTECDTTILVPEIEKLSNTLRSYIEDPNSSSFDLKQIIPFESCLFNMPFTCDDYSTLYLSLTSLNLIISQAQYQWGFENLEFSKFPSISQYCKQEQGADRLCKYFIL